MIIRKESLVAKKAFGFALAIIAITRILPKTYENIILIRQIIRSATSIGANIEEALGGNSRKEFIHSMNIAKKEARETRYWLSLIMELNKIEVERMQAVLSQCDELINILTKIVKTSSL